MRENHHKNTIFIIAAAFLLAAVLFCGAAAGAEHTPADHSSWTPWGNGPEEKTSLPGDPGSYYLTADVTLSQMWTIESGEINLCLNGHSISLLSGIMGSVIYIKPGATLNLYDCGKTGKITDGNAERGCGVYVDGTFNMYGGSITSNYAWSIGGGVYVASGGEFTMNDGTITDNSANEWGGGVYVSAGGEFTMEGGKIQDNRAEQGGGVMVYGSGGYFSLITGSIEGNTATKSGGGVEVSGRGNFTMYDGTITGNTAGEEGGGGVYANNSWFTMKDGKINGNTSSANGGGVEVGGTVLNLEGGTITGNTASWNGGGVFVDNDGKFSMSDNAGITGNSAANAGGVFVDDGGTFNMDGGSIIGNWATSNGGVGNKGTFSVKGNASVMNNSSNNLSLSGSGVLNLTGELTGTVLVTPGYEGAFGTASNTEDATHIINETNSTYAEITTGDEPGKLIWSGSGAKFSGTLITLNWNTGSGNTGKIVAYEKTKSFSIAAPTKAAHGFTGWYLEEEGTTLLINKDGTLEKGVSPYTNSDGEWIFTEESLALYAGWEQNGTVLTLNGNGGTPESQEIMITKGSSKAESFETPVNPDGCRFTGWYLEGRTTLLINTNGTLVYTDATKDYVDPDGKWIYNQVALPLYAGWRGTIITYYDGTEKKTDEVALGQQFVVKTPNQKPGDEFFGWVYIEDASGASKRFSLYDGTQPVYISNSPYYNGSLKWISEEETLDLYSLWASSAVPGPSPSSGDMTVSYQEGGASYTLSIPSDLTLTKDGVTNTSIGVTNVMVPEGQHVDVTLTSTDVKDDKTTFLLKLTGTNAGEAEYNIAYSEDDVKTGQKLIGNNDKVIAGVESGAGKTQGLYFKMTQGPTTAGKYTGTLTFTASVSS